MTNHAQPHQHLNKNEIVHVVQQMVDAATKAILPHFRMGRVLTENKDKHGFDPVTVADRDAEQAMRAVLSRLRPLDGILGEEFGETPSHNGWRWVLDPIDGTRAFMSGTPTWGVLIALEDLGHGPVFGAIAQPYMNEIFMGGLGLSVLDHPQGRKNLGVSITKSLDDAIIFTTFPEVGADKERAGFEAVARRCKLTRYGMDCYAYALLALGQIDLVIEAGLNAYDIQAPIAVIQAAGGIVTNWTGGPGHHGGQVIAAATPELHAMALEILGQHAS